jgi:tetratricopeptide (TPR) repeat protein
MRRIRAGRQVLWFVLGAGLLALLAGGVNRVIEGRVAAECERLTIDIGRRKFLTARTRLRELARSRPGDGQVQYLLGVSEDALGNTEAAVRAWRAVPAGSPFAGRALVRLARLELASHRWAPAEVLMARAIGEAGPHAVEACKTLVNLAKLEGRFTEARRLVRAAASQYPDPIGLLKELAQLGSHNPHKVEIIRDALARAETTAADDDRVWLGRANLATRTGQLDEAATWIERCFRKRPNDPANWRSRLDLAVTREDVSGVWEALGHLGPDDLEPVEVLQLRAWLAAQAGEDARERDALRVLLSVEPANLSALQRLAELELRAGHADEAARLRTRKGQLDRAKAEYEILLFQPDAAARCLSMARLADQLARPLESRILWTLAARRFPDNPEILARIEQLGKEKPTATPPAATPAGLLRERPAPGTMTAAKPRAALVGASPVFTDDSEAAGLKFIFENGLEPIHHLPETMSGGLAVLDYDGDGWLDVYCVQGGCFPPDPKAQPQGDRLFRNTGKGTFEDVTERSGIAALSRGYGHGVAVGDYDNDGHPDLFVTRWRSYALYHNKGDGTFEEVTDAVGLGGDRDWPTSAAFADLDGDGDLDLYVCHYLEWDDKNPKPCWDEAKKAYVFCGPPRFPSLPDHLFRNDGGRFVDITNEAGIVDPHGEGLGVIACDFDGDGLVDLFVANDQSANYYFKNLGNLRFEEMAESNGVGSNAEGTYMANMGLACGDFDEDGLADVVVTAFYNEGAMLLKNLGDSIFTDYSRPSGLRLATRYMLGFGTSFLDFNADGKLDLVIANGHVDDFRPDEPWMMPAQLLAGTGDHRFVEVSAAAGAPWQVPRLGRGLVAADLDNDGRMDLLILSQNQPLAYLHNRTEGGYWLVLKLEGTTSNRDAVGARVNLTVGGRRRTAWRFGGGSYQSAGDPRLYFGLGPADRVEQVEVVWPDGQVQRFGGLSANTGFLLRQGEPTPRPLPGYTPPWASSR